jgi:hypothetical protein
MACRCKGWRTFERLARVGSISMWVCDPKNELVEWKFCPYCGKKLEKDKIKGGK